MIQSCCAILRPTRYLTRGWCRLEIWCRLLSQKSCKPFLVVKDEDEIEFCASEFVADCPPHEGDFTLDTDRVQINSVMRRALRARSRALKEAGEWDMYRYTVSRSEALVGAPPTHRNLERFLGDFCSIRWSRPRRLRA